MNKRTAVKTLIDENQETWRVGRGLSVAGLSEILPSENLVLIEVVIRGSG